MRAIAATNNDHTRSTGQRLLMVLLYLAAVMAASTAFAQGRTGAKKEKPKPRTVTLKTKDGIKLSAYYFPSDQEKKAIPVLLIHEWQGQASPFAKLVMALNKAGCAVLIPNYRGHGSSKEYIDVRGETREFNLAQMSKRDVENIIAYDLEKAKSFLKDENNAETLNLNALVVIGVREGCVMAARWAQRDWNFPSIGNVKQGQDVKALVLISPKKQIKGVAIDPTLTDRNIISLPIMVVAGKSSEEADEAERIGKRIQSFKKRLGRGVAEGFDLAMPNNKLSGAALINEQSSGVIPVITNFVKSQVTISDDENPWIERD